MQNRNNLTEQYRAIIPAASVLCRSYLTDLRAEWRAANVRHHHAIQRTGAWSRLPLLYFSAAHARYSLFMLALLLPWDVQESRRMHHLERVLRFCTQAAPLDPAPGPVEA